jgi:lipopolysaccharide/colanic/teichoic acid biosynthesis glycosyltransferase
MAHFERGGMVRSTQQRSESVVLVGTDRIAWLYIRALSTIDGARQKIVAVLDVNRAHVGRKIAGHVILGDYTIALDLLDEMAVHGVRVDRIVVTAATAGPGSAPWTELSRVCNSSAVELDFLPERLNLLSITAPSSMPGPGAVNDAPMITGWYWRAKRGVDVALAAAGIFFLSPLLALTALLVGVSFGFPLVFWQERVGRAYCPIRVHKFRTMRAPFDRYGQRRSDLDRETGVGRFLRATRLDELPQLLDILRGDMSLIGPRPLLPVDQPPDARLRLSVRPGLTGWAQVHGGKAISPDEKNALDVWYIQHASPMVDLKILLLTMKTVLVGDRRDERTVNHAVMPLSRQH